MKRVRITKEWHESVYHNLTGLYDENSSRVHLDAPSRQKVTEYNKRTHNAYTSIPSIAFSCVEECTMTMETE